MSASFSFQHYEKSKRDFLRALRSLFAFCLGIFLSAWVCFANAAMTGYQFDQRCIETQAELMSAFVIRSQYLSGGTDYELCGGVYAPIYTTNPTPSGASAPMAIKYYMSSFNKTSEGCLTTQPRYMGIPSCDPDAQSLALTGTNALFLVLGFFYASMLGFKTGYRA